jgi:hypothetical protein
MVKGRASSKAPSGWTNALLVAITIVLGVACAEGTVRYLNGQPLFAFALPEPISWNKVKQDDLDAVPLSPGVQKAWFDRDPAPLPNRRDPPAGWQAMFDKLRATLSDASDFRPTDAFKVFNTARIPEICSRNYFARAPDRIFVYDPPDGGGHPPYRFYPNVTLPDQLATNQVGWRGAPIEVPRAARTIRIVFVGSSTVVDSHSAPYSYPELTGHWLNMWAQAQKLDVRFEALNAARESIISTDIAAIVRTEVLPLEPDLVVYYEGGNQFGLSTVVPDMPAAKLVRPNNGATLAPAWLKEAARYSALLGRVQAGIGLANSELDGKEWPKPDYKLVWPQGLDEQDPDLDYPKLPINLGDIKRDLDQIRTDLARTGSEFALSSFIWIVRDGMVVNPAQRRGIIEQLNVQYYPFRYRDLERMAKFQNRFFAKYSRVHGMPFIDFAGLMPFDTDLYIDALHSDYAGTRLRGWIAFQQLLPTIQKHLADGSWPRPANRDTKLPEFAAREIATPCNKPGI